MLFLKRKKKDLLSLLKFIPDLYHDFYKNLIFANNNEDPLALEEGEGE